MKWYAGSDHAGYRLKQLMIAVLKELGDEVVDVGTLNEDSTDYPQYGHEVGTKVVGEPGTMGTPAEILKGGTADVAPIEDIAAWVKAH